MNVVRIMPLRYSPVTVIAARTISTGTPNTATPIAAFSGGSGAAPYAVDPCSAARPMLSTATAAAVHNTDRVVDSLIRSAVQYRGRAHWLTARYSVTSSVSFM